jgi:isopentenyl diphosphate isomerase/L-lactate dehydrogenase-like FMN-dependent dehydrogenase
MAEQLTIGQVIEQAREQATPQAYLWAMAGAGESKTRDRNHEALGRLAAIPRVMCDVSEISTRTTVLGVPVDIPVFASPIGTTSLYHPDGAVAVAEGARRAGTLGFCGFGCDQRWEDVAAHAPQFFQLYVLGDRGWQEAVIDRVEAAGFAGICLTADSAVVSRRDSLLEAAFDMRLGGKPATNLGSLGNDESYRRRFDWSDLAWLCGKTKLPVAVKGVLSPQDAVLAIDNGAAAVYVSNHGGRTVDHGPATIEVLPEIVEAVDGRAEVLIDGGFTRGVEVCQAIALGARAVGIGRLHLWGLTVGGADGLANVFELLRREIADTMGFLGATSVADLDRDHVRIRL